jgi:protein-S-isoprenylcysteine O-methyltransferase Ste14
MQATDFEFRHRLWFIGALFTLAFWSRAVDPVTAGAAVAGWMGGPHRRRLLQAVFGAGAVLTLAAAVLRTWASAYLDSEVVHDSQLRTERVVADGPYRYVRNPLYLGISLMSAGMGLLASRWGGVLLVAGLAVFEYRLIRREEELLLATQGEGYRRFLAAVPRWWPALSPRAPASGRHPRWGQAFAGEAFFWGFAAAQTAFAVTLNRNVAGYLILLSLAVYAVSRRVVRRKGAAG